MSQGAALVRVSGNLHLPRRLTRSRRSRGDTETHPQRGINFCLFERSFILANLLPKRANLFPRSLQRVAHRVQLVRRCWWKMSLLGGHRVAGRANDKRAAVLLDSATCRSNKTALLATGLLLLELWELEVLPPAAIAHGSARIGVHREEQTKMGLPMSLVGCAACVADLSAVEAFAAVETLSTRRSHNPETAHSELGMLTVGNTFGPVGRTNGTSSVQIRKRCSRDARSRRGRRRGR